MRGLVHSLVDVRVDSGMPAERLSPNVNSSRALTTSRCRETSKPITTHQVPTRCKPEYLRRSQGGPVQNLQIIVLGGITRRSATEISTRAGIELGPNDVHRT